MTREQFLAWEEGQDLRWEFDGVTAHAMTGGTLAHARIQSNLNLELRLRLQGSSYMAYGSDFKVNTKIGYRYPDIHVTGRDMAPSAKMSDEPVALFEVPSDSTAREDRTKKLSAYLALTSVQHYVMLEQDIALATVMTRTATGWSIVVVDHTGAIALPALNIELPMSAVYDGLTFEPALG